MAMAITCDGNQSIELRIDFADEYLNRIRNSE